MSLSFSLKFALMILVVNVFSERVVCVFVFLTVKFICCSYGNLLLTKICFVMQARALNADQIRYDSRSTFSSNRLAPL